MGTGTLHTYSFESDRVALVTQLFTDTGHRSIPRDARGVLLRGWLSENDLTTIDGTLSRNRDKLASRIHRVRASVPSVLCTGTADEVVRAFSKANASHLSRFAKRGLRTRFSRVAVKDINKGVHANFKLTMADSERTARTKRRRTRAFAAAGIAVVAGIVGGLADLALTQRAADARDKRTISLRLISQAFNYRSQSHLGIESSHNVKFRRGLDNEFSYVTAYESFAVSAFDAPHGPVFRTIAGKEWSAYERYESDLGAYVSQQPCTGGGTLLEYQGGYIFMPNNQQPAQTYVAQIDPNGSERQLAPDMESCDFGIGISLPTPTTTANADG